MVKDLWWQCRTGVSAGLMVAVPALKVTQLSPPQASVTSPWARPGGQTRPVAAGRHSNRCRRRALPNGGRPAPRLPLRYRHRAGGGGAPGLRGGGRGGGLPAPAPGGAAGAGCRRGGLEGSRVFLPIPPRSVA